MGSLSGIKGQDNALRYLMNSLEKGRRPASYLFSGPAGVGRALSAAAFIKKLMCKEGSGPSCRCPVCARIDAGEHPDIMWIKPGKNRKIKIEEIRELKDLLGLKPFESPLSAGVIEDAHMMTQEASNALLKTLEEPPGNSIIILISDKKELLLPTVVSRCSEVRFVPLPAPVAREIIASNSDVDESTAEILACFSQGSAGLALEMAGEGFAEKRAGFSRRIKEVSRGSDAYRLAWEDVDRDGIIEDIEALIMLLRDVVLEREGMGEMVLDKQLVGTAGRMIPPGKDIAGIYGMVAGLVELKLALGGNANPNIAAQALPEILTTQA